MAQDTEKTVVLFRKWPSGTVLALFPGEVGDCDEESCSSYQHVGQHGSANFKLCIQTTKPAKPEEYESLRLELESPPYEYSLDVRRRVHYGRFYGVRAEKLKGMEKAQEKFLTDLNDGVYKGTCYDPQ
jgi:hypothetical protein